MLIKTTLITLLSITSYSSLADYSFKIHIDKSAINIVNGTSGGSPSDYTYSDYLNKLFTDNPSVMADYNALCSSYPGKQLGNKLPSI